MCAPRVTRHTSIRYSSSCHTHVSMGACVARTWISYGCVPCHPWCTHRTLLVVKNFFQFSCGCEQLYYGRSFGFLVINICNHGEHYETSRTNQSVNLCKFDKERNVIQTTNLSECSSTSVQNIVSMCWPGFKGIVWTVITPEYSKYVFKGIVWTVITPEYPLASRIS
jgi:hypothetical protein